MSTQLGERVEAGRPDRPRWRRPRWLDPVLIIAAFLLASGALGGLQLSDVQRNDSRAHLPERAEATAVLADSQRFTGLESTTAIVVYSSPDVLTTDDERDLTLTSLRYMEQFSSRLASPPAGPILSDDHKAAEIILNFIGSDEDQIRADIDLLRQIAGIGTRLEPHITGPAGATADLTTVFGEINGVLLLVTAILILLILVAAYRSPVMPFLVLGIAGIGLGLANGTAYVLAKADIITISGDAQSILDVLVLGAGTDYALLLASRFREELRRTEDRYAAMREALRASVPAIAASGGTVMVGLLCLLASNLPSIRVLGPVSAIAIAFALLSMLVLFPAALVLLGRFAFWPFRPRVEAEPAAAATPRGLWARIAGFVGRRPRVVWVGAALALVVLSLGMLRLQANGVPRTESFLAPADSVTGAQIIAEHYGVAAGTPVIVITRAEGLDGAVRAVRAVPGVSKVEPYLDPLVKFDNARAGKPPPPPKVVDGLSRMEVTLADGPDTPQAVATVRQIRSAVRAVPGADARVGGYTAANIDVQDTAQRDRLLIIPLVLFVVFLILMVLLRSVVAPLLLIATVILSFLATMGVCGVVFRDVFGFAGADSTFPLSAFVFLVALGVDYNIFLMTRVREEVAGRGHRAGTISALGITGGVITSAGVVLAATFAALGILPLVFLAELAFAVAFGVLLDTLIVRSLLVPALTVDIGRKVWWPGELSRADP